MAEPYVEPAFPGRSNPSTRLDAAGVLELIDEQGGGGEEAVAAHEAAVDPHPVYETSAEAQAKVDAAVAALVNAAPATLNTLKELSDALGADASYAATIATALAGKQPLDSDLTAIAALISGANKVPYATGSGAWSLADMTAAGRALIDDADAAAQLTTLGAAAASHSHAGADITSGTVADARIASTIARDSEIVATKLDDFAATDDNTDLNATTSAHGLLPKLGGGSANFLRADGTWNAPAGTGGLSAGTSFPVSPATGDLFFRTDRGLLYFFDGTRWLTTTLYHLGMSASDSLLPNSVSPNVVARQATWAGQYDLWLVDFMLSYYVLPTNTGSAFWTLTFQKESGATTTTIVAPTTAAGSASAWTRSVTSINALLGATDAEFSLKAAKTGSPGNVFAFGAFTYRLVG